MIYRSLFVSGILVILAASVVTSGIAVSHTCLPIYSFVSSAVCNALIFGLLYVLDFCGVGVGDGNGWETVSKCFL